MQAPSINTEQRTFAAPAELTEENTESRPATSGVRRFVILHRNVFSLRDWNRFGCDYFEQHGFEVIPVNCAKLVFGDAGERLETAANRPHPKTIRAENAEDVCRILADCSSNDLVLILLQLLPTTAPVYAAIGKRKIPYAVMDSAILPLSLDWRSMALLRVPVAKTFQQIRHSSYQTLAAIKRILAVGADFMSLPAPSWWIRCGNGINPLTSQYPKVWSAELIPFDSYYFKPTPPAPRAANAPSAGPSQKAVFVDAGVVSHPEWKMRAGGSPIDGEKYFAAMRRVFGLVEREFGLRVEIAAHPSAEYLDDDLCFGGRPIVWGQTDRLIENADLVLMHHSTTVSTAVMARKPIVFLTNDDFENTEYGWMGLCMHTRLRQPRFNVDRQDEIENISVPAVDEQAYRRYERTFLFEDGAQSGPPWPLLLAAFEKSTPATETPAGDAVD